MVRWKDPRGETLTWPVLSLWFTPGGERKRVTTAEMLVGPRKILMMDEVRVRQQHLQATAHAAQIPVAQNGRTLFYRVCTLSRHCCGQLLSVSFCPEG